MPPLNSRLKAKAEVGHDLRYRIHAPRFVLRYNIADCANGHQIIVNRQGNR